MVTEHSETEHLDLQTVENVTRALRQAETLFRALNTFDIPEGSLIDMGESIRSLPADTIFYALVERGIAVTRKAICALDPSQGDVATEELAEVVDHG